MIARRLMILLASLALTLAGCSDDTDDSTPSNNGVVDTGTDVADMAEDAGSDATSDVASDASGGQDADASEGHDASQGSDADASDQQDAGQVQSCSEISAQSCFANADCADNERCENVGTAAAPVACCVEGARGTKSAGESCTEVDDGPECASGICITGDSSSLCSTTCTTADECPDGMKDCKPIAFSGSDDSWCFPTN